MSCARILVGCKRYGLREMIRFALEREGFPCDGAEYGQQALAMIERHDYEVAVLSAKMEGMTGYGVLEQAREMRPDLGVVIVGGPPIRVDDWRITVIDQFMSTNEITSAVLEMFVQRALRRAA